MDDIDELQEKIIAFRDERDWKQFHKPKDLAISLSLEAAEVLEHFQWKSEEEIDGYIKTNKKEIGEELADVFNYLLLISDCLEIDLLQATEDKLEKSAQKYPADKAKGTHKKYTELDQA